MISKREKSWSYTDEEERHELGSLVTNRSVQLLSQNQQLKLARLTGACLYVGCGIDDRNALVLSML